MEFQNFIYLLFAAVWISGLIWAGVIALKTGVEMMIGDEKMVEVNCRKYETLTIGLEDDNWEYLKTGRELLFPCKEIERVIVLKHR